MVVNICSLKFEHEINWPFLCSYLFIILTGSLAHEIYESLKKKSEALQGAQLLTLYSSTLLALKKKYDQEKELEVKKEKEGNKSFKQMVWIK